MKIRFQTVIFGVSVVFNILFVSLFALAGKGGTSFVTYKKPDAGHVTAASVVSVPEGAAAAFNAVEIVIQPGEKAYLQFSALRDKKQSNILIQTLYDPDTVHITQIPGYGIEITGVNEGRTLLQTIDAGGIHDIALVSVWYPENVLSVREDLEPK